MTTTPSNLRTLSSAELAFFKDKGYVILRNVLDKTLCRRARDRIWSALPEGSSLLRDKPETHVGPFPEEEESDDPLHIRKGHLWQLRECGTEPDMLNLLYSANLTRVAEDLLGKGTLVKPKENGSPMGSQGPAWPGGPTDPAIGEGIRGIYLTLPYSDKSPRADMPHTDGHPFNLGCVGLINDVPPEGGSFRVWPGSHKRLYPTFQMQYDQPRIPYYDHMPSHKGLIQSPEYEAEFARILEDTEPVDCHGNEGDVIFWHHRLVHMAGHNYSDTIRQAALCDFKRTDLDTARMDPPQENMWRDWSEKLNECNEGYDEAFARSQGLAS